MKIRTIKAENNSSLESSCSATGRQHVNSPKRMEGVDEESEESNKRRKISMNNKIKSEEVKVKENETPT